MKDERKVAGGLARAQALSPKERSDIARKGAFVRHHRHLPKALTEGVLKIGDLQLACAVLDDENNTRVLTQNGFLKAIGRHPFATGGTGSSIDGEAPFLCAKNLKPFISSDLERSSTPIEFLPRNITSGASGIAYGYKGSLLPDVCWVYQDALLAGKLLPNQKHIGEACRRLLRALTNYAIEDLIDQATGFDDLRKADSIVSNTEPLEDETISLSANSESRIWNRQAPRYSSRQSTSALIDLVARERASSAHHLLEQVTAAAARLQGYDPLYNDQIDMHFPTPYGHVLAEMKSCHRGNLHSQVRRGVSQLFEYQFVYRESLGNDVVPVLIIETEPTREHRWLIAYTESIGILLAWKDASQLVTTVNIPTALSGVVLPQ